MALHGIARHTCLMMMVTRLVPPHTSPIPTILVLDQGGDEDDGVNGNGQDDGGDDEEGADSGNEDGCGGEGDRSKYQRSPFQK